MLYFQFTPFPSISTARLLLRQVTPADATQILALRSNPNIMRYIPRPLAQNLADALQHIDLYNTGIAENINLTLGIAWKNHPDILIGLIGYVRTQPQNHSAEIGYLLSLENQNKGVMHEALNVVIQYGFKTMQLHRIEAVIDPQNTASEKLLQKNGFVKEGYFKENCYFDGQFLDSVYYTLFRKNYLSDIIAVADSVE